MNRRGSQRQSQNNQLVFRIGAIQIINVGPRKDFAFARADHFVVFPNRIGPSENVSLDCAIEIIDTQFGVEESKAFLNETFKVSVDIDFELGQKRPKILFDENDLVPLKISNMEAMAEA